MNILFSLLLLVSVVTAADADTAASDDAVKRQPVAAGNTSQAIPTIRQVPSFFTPGDFSCAKANRENQMRVAPNWDYRWISSDPGRQSIDKAWEPVLEPVQGGCTMLEAGWLKAFYFKIVLDKSWVQHYEQHKQYFSTQGYESLERSPFILLDRVDFLFRRQFGISIRVGKIHILPNLEDDCAENEGRADGTSPSTNTLEMMKADGHLPDSRDATIVRLGAGSLTAGVVCRSYAKGNSLCESDRVLVVQSFIFLPDGRMDYEAGRKLAHELGHIFGVCFAPAPLCEKTGHTAPEHAGIMVGDQGPARREIPYGPLNKFLTTCTPVYRDFLCKAAREKSCGVNIPPPTLEGHYFATQYKDSPLRNAWHDVHVTEMVRGKVFKWTNAAGVSWELTRRADEPFLFDVSESCPYFQDGHTVARVRLERSGRGSVITGIYGPWGELYERQ